MYLSRNPSYPYAKEKPLHVGGVISAYQHTQATPPGREAAVRRTL
jgi:hypothetical protein